MDQQTTENPEAATQEIPPETQTQELETTPEPQQSPPPAEEAPTESPPDEGPGLTLSVKCSHDELVLTDGLTPHPANWNQHPPAQIELFKKILLAQGIRRPIQVSRRSGFVVKGHGLLLALRELGVAQAPVDWQDYESEAEELADLTADNQLSKMAVTDVQALQTIVGTIDTGAFDMELIGMPLAKIEKLMVDVNPIAPPIEPPAGGEVNQDPTAGDTTQTGEGGVNEPAPDSHIKQVQLFFNPEQLKEFQDLANFCQHRFNVDNLTDAVISAMREVYASTENRSEVPAPEGPVEEPAGETPHGE